MFIGGFIQNVGDNASDNLVDGRSEGFYDGMLSTKISGRFLLATR